MEEIKTKKGYRNRIRKVGGTKREEEHKEGRKERRNTRKKRERRSRKER